MKSLSPMTWSRAHNTEKLERETHDAYEKRTWRNKLHVLENGNVAIPPLAIKNALSEAAKFLGMQIPGKGKSTYTKHFESGVLCVEYVDLGIKAADIEPLWLFVPASGIRGDGKRVMKAFPLIKSWEGTAEICITDAAITSEVFGAHIVTVGQSIGLGSLRVRNNGIFGRFEVTKIVWDKK